MGPALRGTLLLLLVGAVWFPGRVEDATGVRVPTAELAIGCFVLHLALTYWPVPQLQTRRAQAECPNPEQSAMREPETVEKSLQRVAARRAASAVARERDASPQQDRSDST